MEDAGQKLKRRREALDLRYRDVEVASTVIAERRNSDEYTIVISRLSEIENRGAVPSIYKIYSLCAIYRLNFSEVVEWYRIDLSALPGDASVIEIGRTHSIDFTPDLSSNVSIPLTLDPGIDMNKTTFLSRMIQRWGKLPLVMLNVAEPKTWRYAWVGMEDRSMYPLIHPGSLLLIDETRRKIQANGWVSEQDRPIYLFEHRDGHILGWCSVVDRNIVIQPHPASQAPVRIYSADQVDVIGQVAGIAMRMEPHKRG